MLYLTDKMLPLDYIYFKCLVTLQIQIINAKYNEQINDNMLLQIKVIKWVLLFGVFMHDSYLHFCTVLLVLLVE